MKTVIVLSSCIFSLALAWPWDAIPRTDDYFVNKHNQFVNTTRDNYTSIRVLFYGDSITDSWSNVGKAVFDEYYAPLGTANYGISGDKTENMLWRIRDGEVTERLNPAVCVVKIGTNNIFEHEPRDIALGIAANIVELRDRLPLTRVLLLGILPRNNEELSNVTSSINAIISPLDDGEYIRFLDMKNHFYLGGGIFNETLYDDDLIHLSEAGYRKWAAVMHPIFREMLESS